LGVEAVEGGEALEEGGEAREGGRGEVGEEGVGEGGELERVDCADEGALVGLEEPVEGCAGEVEAAEGGGRVGDVGEDFEEDFGREGLEGEGGWRHGWWVIWVWRRWRGAWVGEVSYGWVVGVITMIWTSISLF
jgi:hypothetical protein